MLRVVVFDDEHIVVKGLENMIDWTSMGFELVGTAGDGQAALQMIRSLRPDIVLTDIRMPGMDGLTLIETVMREAPETYCIVFSGFNEYEYVKRAIRLGVADYLEKPITIESIEAAIRKAKYQINEQRETLSFRTKWEYSKQELLEKATLDLIMIGEEAEAKWKITFGPESERITSTTVFVSSEDYTFLNSEEYHAVHIRNGQERLIVVFHIVAPSHWFWEELYQQSDNEEIMIGNGCTYPGISQASLSYKEAQRAIRCALFLNIKGIVRFEDLGDLNSTPKGLTEQEEAIILCMRAGNKIVLLDQVDRFIKWIQSQKLDPEVAERELLKLIYLALEVSKESELINSYQLHDTYLPHIEIRDMATKVELMEWFREQFERIADLCMTSRKDSKHDAVERARAYIELNVSRDLSLQQVADHVGMNSAYLSVIFKEVVGESYIKFVTRYRIELAKRLLIKGLKVNEVSERVGYYTYRHFLEVFKKSTGLTPGQYKEQEGNQS